MDRKGDTEHTAHETDENCKSHTHTLVYPIRIHFLNTHTHERSVRNVSTRDSPNMNEISGERKIPIWIEIDVENCNSVINN